MRFLSLDVGTTCCKGQVFSDTGEILFYQSKEYPLKKDGADVYVDVDAITATLKSIIKKAGEEENVSSIAVSSFGEAFVMLDKDDNVLFYPMLYTDVRGEKQAEEIKKQFSEEFLYDTTGILPHAMYSISKVLWIKENHPDKFKKADKILLIGDFVGYVLTGKRVIDYGLAARTGAFDIVNKHFSKEILNKFGIDENLFSVPMPAGTVVGNIKEEIANELNLSKDCKLVLGSHDQICATLGAGIMNVGEAADGMGTVECITALYDKPPKNPEFGRMGYPTVPFAKDGVYCTYILNYSSGSLINWFKDKLNHGYFGDKDNFFSYIEEKIGEKTNDLLMLPYFAGCANPYQDGHAKGAILNLTLSTSDADIYRAILEGTSFEMRLNLEIVKSFGIDIKSAVATGGGANSDKWLQIKSDITGLNLKTLRSSEGGLCGVAILQAVALNRYRDLSEAKDAFVRYKKEFLPNDENLDQYKTKYEKYKKIYKKLMEMY